MRTEAGVDEAMCFSKQNVLAHDGLAVVGSSRQSPLCKRVSIDHSTFARTLTRHLIRQELNCCEIERIHCRPLHFKLPEAKLHHDLFHHFLESCPRQQRLANFTTLGCHAPSLTLGVEGVNVRVLLKIEDLLVDGSWEWSVMSFAIHAIYAIYEKVGKLTLLL